MVVTKSLTIGQSRENEPTLADFFQLIAVRKEFENVSKYKPVTLKEFIYFLFIYSPARTLFLVCHIINILLTSLVGP